MEVQHVVSVFMTSLKPWQNHALCCYNNKWSHDYCSLVL